MSQDHPCWLLHGAGLQGGGGEGTAWPGPLLPTVPDHKDKADPTASSLKAGCRSPPACRPAGELPGRVRSQALPTPPHHPSSPGSEAEGGVSPGCYKLLATLELTQAELRSASRLQHTSERSGHLSPALGVALGVGAGRSPQGAIRPHPPPLST